MVTRFGNNQESSMRGAVMWAKAGLAVLLLYVLSRMGTIDFRPLAGAWNHIPVLLASAALLFAGVVIGAVRWAILLRVAGIAISVITVFRLQLIGTMFCVFLPGAAGGDAARAAYLCRVLPAQRTTGLTALAVDRLFSLFGLVALTGLLLLASAMDIAAHPMLVFYAKLTAGALALAAVLTVIVYVVALRLKVPVFPHEWLERLRPFMRQIRDAILLYGRHWIGILACAFLSVFGCFVVVVGIVILSRIFSFAPEAHVTALAGTLGNISSAIPLTPGGIGIGEAMFGRVCADLASSTAPYATIYLAFRILMALVSLVGIIPYIFFDPARERALIHA